MTQSLRLAFALALVALLASCATQTRHSPVAGASKSRRMAKVRTTAYTHTEREDAATPSAAALRQQCDERGGRLVALAVGHKISHCRHGRGFPDRRLWHRSRRHGHNRPLQNQPAGHEKMGRPHRSISIFWSGGPRRKLASASARARNRLQTDDSRAPGKNADASHPAVLRTF